jgi:Ca2+-binding EF-hand superfamily protein
MLELRLRRMIEDASTSESSLRRLFSRFDKDNSGKLSRQEMKRVFNELGVKSSDAEIQELIFGLDKSNDGLCSYEEFIRIAFPSSNVDSAAGSSGIGSTSSLVTLLTERLKEMIRLASGSERELRALFSKFDTQNTGRITRNKFQRAFANMGLSAPAKEVQQLIDSMDTNGDGMVSYGEFVSVVHNNSSSGSRNRNIPSRVHEVLQRLVNDNSWTRTSLRRLFLSFDKDNSGYITRSEFRRVFNENLKIRASDSEIDELIRTIDTNRDGRISYAEFIDIAYQGRNSTSAIAADNRRGGSSRRNDRDDYYDDDRRGGRNNNSSLRRTPRNEFFGRGQSDLVEKFKSAMRRANWTRASLNDLFNKFDGNESCFFCYWCFFFS